MKRSDWPAQDIQEVAQRSGKPLEVSVALAFLSRGWDVELGSYFADGALDELRELDVLATREKTSERDGNPTHVRVLLSCKGFKPDEAPLTYSLSQSGLSSFARPRFLSFRNDRTGAGGLSGYDGEAASLVLKETGLTNAGPLIAFEILRRKEEGKAERQKVSFEGLGDRRIYEGLDSALKAAFFWENRERNSNSAVTSLHVPVLVFSVPFWDVCIDEGTVAAPTIANRGYHSARYPRNGEMESVTTLVWSIEDISSLVDTLDHLFNWFFETRETRWLE